MFIIMAQMSKLQTIHSSTASLWQFNMLTQGPEIWTNTAYEISTLWVKLKSQMQNKLQTWYWSIMPQAEQSRSVIFESKPIDLKEWETTLAVILLLLICDNTNKMCQLEWAMYCKHPGGELSPHKKSQE